MQENRVKQHQFESGSEIEASPGAHAYPHPLDAIVLAGTHRNPKRLIAGRNKAFLEIDARPLVRHVVDALLEAKGIDHIYVVGPLSGLRRALEGV
ncbi:MAG: NTP transferase domain-containing protein, partial [Xanthomonadales bacterium]|nr:NTP transferase domain-containing protein [Xanthomonadales bacterium]